jgi:hypothetical protein
MAVAFLQALLGMLRREIREMGDQENGQAHAPPPHVSITDGGESTAASTLEALVPDADGANSAGSGVPRQVSPLAASGPKAAAGRASKRKRRK